MVSKKTSIVILISVTLLIIVIGFLLKPFPQPQTYHHFADQRNWLGVTNAVNVLSNIPIALVGVWGLFLLFSPGKLQFIDHREKWPWIVISIGLLLTAIGSSYYHLAPDNARLVWDRLPMVIVFMSLVAAMISERINLRLGLWLWPVLLAIGIYSVIQWYMSELHSAGDLRFYAGVQLYAIAVMLVMLLVPSPYIKTWDLALAALCYLLAKIFEIFDHQIYMMSGNIISGHTLKHLAVAMTGFYLLRMVWKRKLSYR